MKLYSLQPGASASMRADEDFVAALKKAVATHNIRTAVETGTYDGLGSTQALIKALEPVPGHRIFTIESNVGLYDKAVANLKPFPWVTPMFGLSVVREAALEWMKNDDYIKGHALVKDVYIDDTKDPLKFYTDELGEAPDIVAQDLLNEVLPEVPGVPLIMLDSAGGIGWMEFNLVNQIMGDRSYVVALDDCDHIKHYRSRHHIINSPGWTLLANATDWRWMVAYRKGTRPEPKKPVTLDEPPAPVDDEVYTEGRKKRPRPANFKE